MRKSLLCIVVLLGLHHPATAQIGVNTPNPKAMFHLDGKKNNETSGNVSPANQADDVVMTDNGFVGIGNNNPVTSLDIKTTGTSAAPVPRIKIADGAQNANYVLTSDSNGNGTWKPVRLTVVRGVNGLGINIPFNFTNTFQYTGSYIDLPPGKWLVTVQQLVLPAGAVLTGDQWMWLRTSFSDDPNVAVGGLATYSTDLTESPTLVSGLVQGPTTSGLTRFSIIQGSLIINNSSGSLKRYKYIAGSNSVGGAQTGATYFQSFGGDWSENIIYAVPTN
ncbi:hypothetical protein [Chryseobacterium indologenes]|uniref:hypothetical protein n=1 Tax=Chryseobacterium indologenes TaxID=253 RepID=UPI001629696B|nr:hypothetical protein [Chryseobacterium indologenes]MBF6642922.1 hypothetical protein [Chryseobacterium indologenes]MBU3049886.1 hypothetical protein [Chryseobacterium indologenes]QQQ73191.1 hypothetical protein JHW31_10840 [Chryseobacterium indologenes]